MENKKDDEIKNDNDTNSVPNNDGTTNSSESSSSTSASPSISEEEVKKLQARITELENKVKYNQAELINYRKRKDEEVSNMLKFANQDLILELIPIADNFERAIKLDDTNLEDSLSKFLAGFKMIYSNFAEALKKYGVEEIETVGKEFDPNVHEALMTAHDESKPNDFVVDCLSKGYTLKGKVIRAAKVIVNKLD